MSGSNENGHRRWFDQRQGELDRQQGAQDHHLPNSFRKDWKSAALRKDKKIYNYEIGNTKYTYDATSDKSLATTHVEYQYDDLNLLSVHHALLQTGVTPVTWPSRSPCPSPSSTTRTTASATRRRSRRSAAT